jgi:hypothetical protein
MAKALSTPHAEISNEQHEQMARDIIRASERLWDGDVECAYDAIQLENLWPILQKYIKVKNDEHQ